MERDPSEGRRFFVGEERLAKAYEAEAELDLPPVYIVRVAEAAWADLGIPPDARHDIDDLVDQDAILRKFYDTYGTPEAVDRGTLLRQATSHGVFRIREGGRRAAVWYDRDGGVVWLCRVLSLSDFHEEDHLYDEFGRLDRAGALLPAEDEIEAWRGEQYLASLVDALVDARDEAFEYPGTEVQATLVRPNGDELRAGRCYVERDELNGGEVVTRLILVLHDHPEEIQMPDDWRDVVVADCFSGDEEVEERYHDLPITRHADEWPLVQTVLEEH